MLTWLSCSDLADAYEIREESRGGQVQNGRILSAKVSVAEFGFRKGPGIAAARIGADPSAIYRSLKMAAAGSWWLQRGRKATAAHARSLLVEMAEFRANFQLSKLN